MSVRSAAPATATLDVPMDAWTEPFWAGTRRHELLMPACGECGTFRWPPGPFCARCHSQAVRWSPAGPGLIYSFTVVRAAPREGVPLVPPAIPALIEFPEAGGVRLLAAIIDADPATVRIDDAVEVGWTEAANATLPVFRLRA